jgi:putative FmdB family regulatory protein
LPIYEYRCQNGHTFEVMQSMSDPPVDKCEVCGAPVERVFRPVAVHFKGSGFYSTDYGRKGTKAGAKEGEASGAKEKASSDAAPKDTGSGAASDKKASSEKD